jgi:hypothetical protein
MKRNIKKCLLEEVGASIWKRYEKAKVFLIKLISF